MASEDHGDKNPCAICLEPVSEKAIAHPCGHIFDFGCLATWLLRNPTCPLCKYDIPLVDYNFTSTGEFQTYNVTILADINLEETRNQQQPQEIPSEWQSSPSLFPTRPRERHTRRRRNGTQVSELRERHMRRRRTGTQVSEINTRTERNFGNIYSLGYWDVSRRLLQVNKPRPGDSGELLMRKLVYHTNIPSAYIGSNRYNGYRDFTAAQFRNSQPLIHKARLWIRREFNVFRFPETRSGVSHNLDRREINPEYLLEFIIHMLMVLDINGGAGQGVAILSDYMEANHAILFLHELRAWLRSPHIYLGVWDRTVQYRWGASEVRLGEMFFIP